MPKPYNIVIAEDHRILREGIKSLLSTNPAYRIAGEAANGLEAIRCVEKSRPDLVLIDLTMPKVDGLDAISEIKNRCPDTKILVLTVHKAEEYVYESLKSGADGYLLKDAAYAELKLAMDSILQGKHYISPSISDKLVNGYLSGKKIQSRDCEWSRLTRREKMILKMVAKGQKNKEIAEDLGISIKTVETHRSNLMKKLDLHSASELTAYAIKTGLVDKQAP